MIMALVSTLEQSTSSKKKKKNQEDKSEKKSDDNSLKAKEKLSDAEKWKKKDAKIPDWKKKAPAPSASKTMEKDGKTYYWCWKCRGAGKGLWALHKESDHKDDFKFESKEEKDMKQLSFSTDTKQSDAEPAISVSKNLLSNAKAYLAQFNHQDFQNG
jgi:hypothetical protein